MQPEHCVWVSIEEVSNSLCSSYYPDLHCYWIHAAVPAQPLSVYSCAHAAKLVHVPSCVPAHVWIDVWSVFVCVSTLHPPSVCAAIGCACVMRNVLLAVRDCVICVWNTPPCVHIARSCQRQTFPLEDNRLSMLSSCAYWEICLSLWASFPPPCERGKTS